MASTAQRRLLQEYKALTNNPPEGITAGPVNEGTSSLEPLRACLACFFVSRDTVNGIGMNGAD